MIRVEPIIGEEIPSWLEPDWRRLLSVSHKPNFQLEFNIIESWARLVRQRWRILLLVVYDSNEIIGIFPLMFRDERRRGVLPYRRLRFIAHGTTDFSAVLASSENVDRVVEASIEWLISGTLRWELLILDDIPDDNPALSPLFRSLLSIRLKAEISIGKYLFVDLSKPWAETWALPRMRFVRRRVSQARRRISEAGEWRFIDNPSWSIERIISTAAAIHHARQKALGRQSLYLDPAQREFMTETLNHHLRKGRLRTHWLRYNNKEIAYLIGLVDSGTYYVWNLAFLPEYADFNPSHLLFAEVIPLCCEQKLTTFDFMRGEAEYKAKWAGNHYDNIRATIRHKSHLYGRFVHGLDALLTRRRKVLVPKEASA